MKHTDTAPASSDESRLDDLLRDFFANEMPAELRELEGVAPQPLVRKAVAARSVSRRAFVQWSAIALCLVMIGFAFGVSSARRNEPAAPLVGTIDGTSVPISDVIPNLAQPAGRPAGFSLSENVQPVESLTYDTLNGPVQQRTNVSTTSVSFIEPGTGDLLEMVLPELTIEIFPIDDPRANDRKSGRNELNEKPKGTDTPVLLPEQQSGSSPTP